MLFVDHGATVLALGVLVAFVVDLRLGEPPARLHPVVWIGGYLSWADRRIAPAAGDAREDGRADLRRFAGGAAAWWTGAGAVTVPASSLQRLVAPWPPQATSAAPLRSQHAWRWRRPSARLWHWACRRCGTRWVERDERRTRARRARCIRCADLGFLQQQQCLRSLPNGAELRAACRCHSLPGSVLPRAARAHRRLAWRAAGARRAGGKCQ